MSVPKDHHLLPAFYLRGFCNGELHEREAHEDAPKRCRVFIHDRDRGKCRGRGVGNVAVERHFYSADTPEGGRDPEPERKLGVLEHHASRIIRGLAYGKGLTDVQRAWLARFVAYMKFRTPAYRDWTELFAEQNAKALKELYFPTPDSMRDYLRTRGVPVDAMPEKIEELHVHDDGYKLPVTKNYMLLRMFELGDKVAEVLFPPTVYEEHLPKAPQSGGPVVQINTIPTDRSTLVTGLSGGLLPDVPVGCPEQGAERMDRYVLISAWLHIRGAGKLGRNLLVDEGKLRALLSLRPAQQKAWVSQNLRAVNDCSAPVPASTLQASVEP